MKFLRKKKKKGELEKAVQANLLPLVCFSLILSFCTLCFACVEIMLFCTGKVGGPDLKSFIRQFPVAAEGIVMFTLLYSTSEFLVRPRKMSPH